MVACVFDGSVETVPRCGYVIEDYSNPCEWISTNEGCTLVYLSHFKNIQIYLMTNHLLRHVSISQRDNEMIIP